MNNNPQNMPRNKYKATTRTRISRAIINQDPQYKELAADIDENSAINILTPPYKLGGITIETVAKVAKILNDAYKQAEEVIFSIPDGIATGKNHSCISLPEEPIETSEWVYEEFEEQVGGCISHFVTYLAHHAGLTELTNIENTEND